MQNINIADNEFIDKTLHVTINDKNPLNSIALGKNSKLNLVIDCHVDSNVHITLAQGATLNCYKIIRAKFTSEIQQQKDSRFNSYVFNNTADCKLSIVFNEPGAEAALNGLYCVSESQRSENCLHIDHKAPHCSSHQFYKGLVSDKAKASFVGKVVVHEGADKTVAHQTNQNLLLSRQAEVNTKPELEIYADDVKCSHGATVGQLDKNALFYLRSRGLSEKSARQLLTEAFVNDVFDRIPDESIKAHLREVV